MSIKVFDNKADKELYAASEELLKATGVPPSYKGFSYIKEAAVILVKESQNPPKIMPLYERVAKKYGVTVSTVEHGIRYAITRACETTNQDMLNSLLPGYINKKKKLPANMYFLRAVAEYVKVMFVLG